MNLHDPFAEEKRREEIYYEVALSNWFSTRFERDKSLLALSSGGVGLLVTLLTVYGSPTIVATAAFGVGVAGYLAVIILALAVLGANADYLGVILTGHNRRRSEHWKAKARQLTLERRLARIDCWIKWCFGVGIAATILVGVTATIAKNQEESDMSKSRPTRPSSSQKPQGTSTKSFGGAAALRPGSGSSVNDGGSTQTSNTGTSASASEGQGASTTNSSDTTK